MKTTSNAYYSSYSPMFWLFPDTDIDYFSLKSKTCFPLQRKTIRVGDTNMLVSKNAKFALPPTPPPNTSRWNKGGIGSPTRGAGVGHVDLMLFVSISFALVSQRELSFEWNMGLRYLNMIIIKK